MWNEDKLESGQQTPSDTAAFEHTWTKIEDIRAAIAAPKIKPIRSQYWYKILVVSLSLCTICRCKRSRAASILCGACAISDAQTCYNQVAKVI